MFNSLGAHASVNHLHIHGMYIGEAMAAAAAYVNKTAVNPPERLTASNPKRGIADAMRAVAVAKRSMADEAGAGVAALDGEANEIKEAYITNVCIDGMGMERFDAEEKANVRAMAPLSDTVLVPFAI
jgi:hypothetical protein